MLSCNVKFDSYNINYEADWKFSDITDKGAET